MGSKCKVKKKVKIVTQMVPLNESIRKLKPICRSIALHTLLNGKISYPCWNLPITIDDMLIKSTHH
jgi:hypothetical protein